MGKKVPAVFYGNMLLLRGTTETGPSFILNKWTAKDRKQAGDILAAKPAVGYRVRHMLQVNLTNMNYRQLRKWMLESSKARKLTY